MNRSELVETLSERHNLAKKQAEAAVATLFGSIFDTLMADGRVEIRGFGSFTTRNYEPYLGRNPKTGASVNVAAKRLPYFKVSKELKGLLNN